MAGKGDTKVKDEKYRDRWCEAPKSKTYSKFNIPEQLWGNWPIEEEADIACGCKERNFWNCLARVLGSVIGPDETTVVVLLWDIEPSNDLSTYKNYTRQRQPLCKAYFDD